MADHVIIGMFTILRKGVGKCRSHALLCQASGILVFHHELLLGQFFEPWMLQGLARCDPVIGVVN